MKGKREVKRMSSRNDVIKHAKRGGQTYGEESRGGTRPQVTNKSPLAAIAVTPAWCAGEDCCTVARILFLGSLRHTTPS